MTDATVTQRLAAIMAADVEGYSRLMQDDEKATVAALDASRLIFRNHVTGHQGRVVDTAGDSILAVFETAIGAAEAGIAIQADLAQRNAQLPDGRQMRFRIGIHLGDVIEKPDGTVYGDGVNIAARLEGLAAAGSVAVSGLVRDGLGRRLDADFDDLGEHVVKNIAAPVRAYCIVDRRGHSDAAAAPPVTPPEGPVEIVFASDLFGHVLAQAEAVAATDATVLIEGESGVGKDLVARRIHEMSRRQNGPFVTFDCASIAPDQFEAELFGQAGGGRDRAGRLEAADSGTLLLDQVEAVPPDLQARLLRPLQDNTFERLGDGRSRRVDVRYIATTTGDLADAVAKGGFRRDVYFRLSVFPIKVPPLRDRPADIPVLVDHFLAGQTGDGGLTDGQIAHLNRYDWPGNVRELQNIVERALILSGDGPLRLDEALPGSAISFPARAPLAEEQVPARGFFSAAEFAELERNNLIAALELSGWQVAGANGAADRLGLTAGRLRSRMKALDIQRPDPESLYARLGGNRGIATFARDLFGRAVGHPVLGRFWKGRSTYGVLREEKFLTAYLAAAAGGPAHYLGRNMIAAHSHLGINAEDWDVFWELLETTLDALSVPAREREEVIAFARTLRDQIVVS